VKKTQRIVELLVVETARQQKTQDDELAQTILTILLNVDQEMRFLRKAEQIVTHTIDSRMSGRLTPGQLARIVQVLYLATPDSKGQQQSDFSSMFGMVQNLILKKPSDAHEVVLGFVQYVAWMWENEQWNKEVEKVAEMHLSTLSALIFQNEAGCIPQESGGALSNAMPIFLLACEKSLPQFLLKHERLERDRREFEKDSKQEEKDLPLSNTIYNLIYSWVFRRLSIMDKLKALNVALKTPHSKT